MPINGFDKDLNLVDGFRVKMSSGELMEHLQKRAIHHRKRAEEKQKDLPKLKEVMESLKGHGKTLATTVEKFSKGHPYNLDTEHPIEDLEKDIVDHNNKAVVFDWFSEHLLPQDYLLDENALRRLEILK